MKTKEYKKGFRLGEMKTHHKFKVKNGNKCSCWCACSEPYRIYKKLEEEIKSLNIPKQP